MEMDPAFRSARESKIDPVRLLRNLKIASSSNSYPAEDFLSSDQYFHIPGIVRAVSPPKQESWEIIACK
jgi:hypothetical protein